MRGTDRFEVVSFLGTWNDKKFFKVRCRETLQFFTMEVIVKQSVGDLKSHEMQFTTVETLPNWGLPFCMELRFVFETQHKRYYVLDFAGDASLADVMNDGLPEPTVLIIAAELAFALEGLHELGVTYNELDLSRVSVDGNGHVVLWREFDGKEYWHISECICGVLAGNCEKAGHRIKRRGSNVSSGQRQWGQVSQGVQHDWRGLGILLCQLLTGQTDFQNAQSLEETILSLFITPNTKDFLYALVSGVLQSFEDLKWHPCMKGLDWDEVKSKSVPSLLMASHRSRLNSAPSKHLSKSPSLQNVYTAGMSARQERGVFMHPSLSRTRSTSDLHSSSSSSKRSLSDFSRGHSGRRSTLSVPCGGQNRPDMERLRGNDATSEQDARNLCYSLRAQAKSSSNLHRQLFQQNSRSSNRPPCLSAPTSPRNSLGSTQSLGFHPHSSAPTSPQGSIVAVFSDTALNLQPLNEDDVFNEPETNPFHEEYRKRWGNATIDTAYGIYSLQLNSRKDGNNNNPTHAATNPQKNASAYGIYSRDFKDNAHAKLCRTSDGLAVSSRSNTNGGFSHVLRQSGHNGVPQIDEVPLNSGQSSSYTTEMTHQGSQVSYYRVDSNSDNTGTNNSSRNLPNSTSRSHCQPDAIQNSSAQAQSQQNIETLTHSLTLLNTKQLQNQKSSANLETSDRIHSSFFQTSSNNQSDSPKESSAKETANILFEKHFRCRRDSFDSEISNKRSPNSGNSENNVTRLSIDKPVQEPQTFIEQSYIGKNTRVIPVTNLISSMTTNNTIPSAQLPNECVKTKSCDEHLQSIRSSIYGYSKVEQGNNFDEPLRLQNFSSSFTHEQVEVRAECGDTRDMFSCNSQTAANNLVSENTVFQKRNSCLPESVVAVHPSINPPENNTFKSEQLSGDGDEFSRFQKQSHRRRSSSASLASSSMSTSKVEAHAGKTPLSRSFSYSNVGDGNVKTNRVNTGPVSPRRSSALRRVPSFEEFRTMRALNKMAYGEQDDGETGQKCASTGTGNSNRNNHNDSTFTINNTSSLCSNTVIRDLLVKYGLDKTSTLKKNQHPKTGPDANESNSPTPSNHNERPNASDTNDTKQRLFNILDDFVAVRTKQKTLSTSSSMCNLKSASSSRERRRSSLPGELEEDNRSDDLQKECFILENKNLYLQTARDSRTKVSCLTDNKPEKCTSPIVVISSPNFEDSYESIDCKNTDISNQPKMHSNSKGTDKKKFSERSQRKHKKATILEKNLSEVKQSEKRTPNEFTGENSREESGTTKESSTSREDMLPLSSDVKTKKREESRRVSEQARKHRESLELVRKSGKKARKERRKSFQQALQNETKESGMELDGNGVQDGTTNGAQSVSKSAPMKCDHTVDIECTSVEKKEAMYLRLQNRRTSSLLSLTDDLGEEEDSLPNRRESLSEFNEGDSQDQEITGADSFLSVDTEFPTGMRASRRESRSSLLSRCSSFHSNLSADSGSIQLDFEDSDEDDELFYPSQPRETPEKTDTEIQRNDSGLGDEIGVGNRAKKRWQDVGYMSSRQSMIIASWRESVAKKADKLEEGQEPVKVEKEDEGSNEIGQQKQRRKISREQRISREKQPNAIDCPDCGRAFVVEKDRQSVKSRGPKQTLICYKCQSYRVERKETIIELVQTEINYGNDFRIIKEEFLSPMQTGGIVSPDNLAKIFLNIQELLDISTKFCMKIQSSMEECVAQNDQEFCHMNVGKIFVENVELFQAYEMYCSRQPEAMSLLESLQKKNDVLRVFLNITCRENPKCRKMDINSFLLAPVQRVTKYPLLLNRIRRATPRWHEDRENLKLAQRKVEEQIAKLNSLTKSSEMKARKFQSNLGTANLVDSSRLKKLASDVLAWTLDEMQLLLHGQLKVLCSEFGGGQSWTKRSLKRSIETHLLFCVRGQNEPIKVDSEEDDSLQFPSVSVVSDASLLLLKRKSNGKYTLFRDEIKLRDCVVYVEGDPDSFGLIHMGKESFMFSAKTSKDARKWIKYLRMQTKNQGKWRRRRNASANIMLKAS